MPLHAAGDYSKGGIGHKISDYVIPSYTSTLAALSPPKPLPSSNKPISILAVSQSQSGACHSYLYPALPNAQEEVCKIEQIASHFKIASQVLQDSAGTVESVLDGMRNHSWVHFACHGTQGIPNPLDSALILHDGRLTMSSLICTERLGHADFAFLSACETAAGAENLVAEAAHLTEAMQRAGYRSIIATMWSIRDADAPIVAEEVYRRMFSMAGKPDSTKAAIALHYATKMLREREAQSKTISFSWVPFIHVGL